MYCFLSHRSFSFSCLDVLASQVRTALSTARMAGGDASEGFNPSTSSLMAYYLANGLGKSTS